MSAHIQNVAVLAVGTLIVFAVGAALFLVGVSRGEALGYIAASVPIATIIAFGCFMQTNWLQNSEGKRTLLAAVCAVLMTLVFLAAIEGWGDALADVVTRKGPELLSSVARLPGWLSPSPITSQCDGKCNRGRGADMERRRLWNQHFPEWGAGRSMEGLLLE